MSSSIFKRNLQKIVTLLLRFAAVMYLFSVVYPYIIDPGFESTFGIWIVRWGLIIGISVFTLGVFILRRFDFLLYGYFLVFITALFQLFVTMISNEPLPGIFVHLYVITTAIYFFTKDIRNTQGHQHHRSRKEKKLN